MSNISNDEKAEDPSSKAALVRLFNETRKRLVETGTRNRLVHVNRANTRGNVINVVNERSDDVHSLLSQRKTMRFLGIARDSEDDSGIALADVGEAGFHTDRFTDAQLETRMGPDALQKRLLKIGREAQTAEEESGVNILYLALGFLNWYEDKSAAVARSAPLILLPVELVRNQRTSTYDVRLRDDDVVTNLPLQQRLRDDFGIQLPEIDIDELWTPSRYVEQVKAVIGGQPAWSIDQDGIQLGFFSFSKLLMYRDLSIDLWPEGAIAAHPLTRGLLYEGFEAEPPLFRAGERLDDALPPEKMFHVVDADASQARVIEEVRSGRNLVVQGPPGTGKSQTITNIIAAAVKEGKRVLFVAEKMAALSVVHDRLVKVGLQDICLELHSRSANKTAVLAELARTLNSAAAIPSMPPPPVALTTSRDRLNALSDLLHTPIAQSGTTPFTVLSLQSRFSAMGVPPPSIASDNLGAMSQEVERKLTDVLARYGELLAQEGEWPIHPFAGVGNLEIQPVELARLPAVLAAASTAASQLAQALDAAATALHVPVPHALGSCTAVMEILARLDALPANGADLARAILKGADLKRLQQALEAGAAWQTARSGAAPLFIESAFGGDHDGLRGALVAGIDAFFVRWGGDYRSASRVLAGLLRHAIPKPATERVALVDRLLTVATLRKRWSSEEVFCADALGSNWRGEQTDFAQVLAVLAWCERVGPAARGVPHDALLTLAQNSVQVSAMQRELGELHSAARRMVAHSVDHLQWAPELPSDGNIDDANLDTIAARFDGMAMATERYAGWVKLASQHAHLVDAGLHELAERMRTGQMGGAAAVAELRYARAERLWNMARDASPLLRDVGSEKRHELVRTFAALERARLSENVTTIRADHLAQVPTGAMGEMKVIRGEIGKKRGHMALRKLFASAGTAVQRIKPVLLMSPISVAQFIPPGALRFDLLVIDEASQVRPEDALGAIARANQIVVVGDQKQLPPSSFFDRLLSDESDEALDAEDGEPDLLGQSAKVGQMESILSLCEARGLSSRMLQWHYRSRVPSLIAVSNHEFYENKLILPPSPLQDDPAYGLRFTRVDGVYDKGGKRDNRIEGEAIVARVAEHARNHPEQSLGIVTFSTAQRSLVTELLEFSRRTDRILDEFLREGQHEDVFVKNIENVQGDERDVILISVCYGPVVPGGRLASMTFGPVNQEGGERRLNVLFSRARVRCEVFASFDPGDIDPGRVSRDGARILKRFLEFARDGRMPDATATGTGAESPFEDDVAEVVKSFGYLIDTQVGSAGFRIDMGVRHPERPGAYVLAVECDGATYHSALWARERDRLRQDVLEHLGWRFHRIWSTDWFYHRAAEVERLRLALDDARSYAAAGVRITGANRTGRVAPSQAQLPLTAIDLPAVLTKQMPAYERAYFPMIEQEVHEVALDALATLVHKIVVQEGPIHFEEVARRLAACCGKEKAGARIVALAAAALDKAMRDGADLASDQEFWFTSAQAAAPPVRDRSLESGATLKAKYISSLEMMAALDLARVEIGGGAQSDIIRVAARLLGFRRVGPDLQERLAALTMTASRDVPEQRTQELPRAAFTIEGPDAYAIEVSGTDAHQLVIAEMLGAQAAQPDTRLRSQLMLDQDGAVSVRVNGIECGHLSTDASREFRQAVADADLHDFVEFHCAAKVLSRDGRHTVWVDLPDDA